MTEEKTLYISDLDGTLLNSDRCVDDESVRLINEAVESGALFSVATARTPATVCNLLRRVDMRIPAVVMTGAALYDFKSGEYIDPKFHKEETVRALLNIYKEEGVATFIYMLGTDNLIHIYHIGPMTPLEMDFIAERSNTPYKKIHIPESGESELPERLDRVLLLYAMQPTAGVERVCGRVKDNAGCRPVFYHDMYGAEIGLLEVFSPEATKLNAARKLKEMCGAKRIVAFGDNVNDMPLMKGADRAVAVANALPEVKAIAQDVIGDHDSQAVAKYIMDSVKSCE